MAPVDIDYLVIPYHTIPYHTIPYHTIPYHTIPYHLYHAMPFHTIPYPKNSKSMYKCTQALACSQEGHVNSNLDKLEL